MIELIRKKFGLKILEKRYCNELINNKNYSKVIVYSFKDLETNWHKEKTCVMWIDLTKELNDIWKGFKKNYRKHIKKEKKEGVVVLLFKRGDKNYERFYKKLYLPLCQRKKLKPYPLNYIKQGDLWIAQKEGEMLAGQIIFHDAEYATQSFNASNTFIEYNGNRLITHTTIKYYKELGLKHFNMGGGYNDYKKRFGSEKKDVWIYYIYNNYFTKIIKRYKSLSKYFVEKKQKKIVNKNVRYF